jgi:hypothetical protein
MASSLIYAEVAPPGPAAGAFRGAVGSGSADNSAARISFKEQREKLRRAIDEQAARTKSICSEDVAVTGCKDDQRLVLMRCVRDYKKKHPEFKFSDACTQSMTDGQELRRQQIQIFRQERKKNKMNKKNKN